MLAKVSNDFSTPIRKDSCRSSSCVNACLCCVSANRHSVLSCRQSLTRPRIAPHSCAWQKPSPPSWLACAALLKRLVSWNVRESCGCWLKTFLSARIPLPFATAFRFLPVRPKTEDQRPQTVKITFCVRGVPTKTVANKENVTINGVKITLLHYVPAHTSGDLMVYLPEQKIVFTGDIIATNQPYTLIHAEKNGSSEGWITTVKGLTGLNADTYVPGHGDLQTKSDVQQRLAKVQARRDEIKKLVAQGKSLDDVKKALGEVDPPLAAAAPQFPSFTTVVYNELTKKSSSSFPNLNGLIAAPRAKAGSSSFARSTSCD